MISRILVAKDVQITLTELIDNNADGIDDIVALKAIGVDFGLEEPRMEIVRAAAPNSIVIHVEGYVLPHAWALDDAEIKDMLKDIGEGNYTLEESTDG